MAKVMAQGECQVKGRCTDRIEENTVIGLGKDGKEIHWSSNGYEKVEKDLAVGGQLKNDIATEGDLAARELLFTLERFNELWQLHYREFKWHV